MSTDDTPGVGIANKPTPQRRTIGQSGIEAHFSTGHAEPSAICIMGTDVTEAMAP